MGARRERLTRKSIERNRRGEGLQNRQAVVDARCSGVTDARKEHRRPAGQPLRELVLGGPRALGSMPHRGWGGSGSRGGGGGWGRLEGDRRSLLRRCHSPPDLHTMQRVCPHNAGSIRRRCLCIRRTKRLEHATRPAPPNHGWTTGGRAKCVDGAEVRSQPAGFGG